MAGGIGVRCRQAREERVPTDQRGIRVKKKAKRGNLHAVLALMNEDDLWRAKRQKLGESKVGGGFSGCLNEIKPL